MEIKPIKTEADYQAALVRLEEVFDAQPGTKKGDELELLSILIDEYEKKHDPIDFPDPVEAIKFRMEQLGIGQKDLAEMLGLKSRASEILNRKRKLTLKMVRKLSKNLNLPADLLIQDY